MSDTSNHNVFTAADIERYYKGSMTAAERHALEKAALDDPFLADALEGFAATATPVEDVSNIQKRLQEKLQKRKATPLFFINNSWLRIAALLLLLAGGGWLVYRFNFNGDKEIAIATPAVQKQPQRPEHAMSTDSAGTIKPAMPEVSRAQTTKESKAIVHKTAALSRRKRSDIQKQEEEKTVALQKNNTQQTETTAIPSYIPPARNPEALLKRSFAGQNQNATAYKTDSMASDSTSALAIAQGVKKTEVSNDTVRLNIVLEPSHESLNEVVEVHLNAKKRATAKPSVHFEELEPAEGWTNFNDYIAENLKEPEYVKEKTVNGDVELSFDINKEGEAVNIKIEKSLCNQCDDEAVRLLKEGPKWKKRKSKKGRVTIHFAQPHHP